MFAKHIIVMLLAALCSAAMAGTSKIGPQTAKAAPVSIQGSWAGIKLVNQMIRQYEYDRGSRFIAFGLRDSIRY